MEEGLRALVHSETWYERSASVKQVHALDLEKERKEEGGHIGNHMTEQHMVRVQLIL